MPSHIFFLLTEKPECVKGSDPPSNRFNVRWGYCWDGVNCSNGFENKQFAMLANKVAAQTYAYKWSPKDMWLGQYKSYFLEQNALLAWLGGCQMFSSHVHVWCKWRSNLRMAKSQKRIILFLTSPCTILVELQLEQHSLLSADTLKINPTLLHYVNLINLIFCHRTDNSIHQSTKCVTNETKWTKLSLAEIVWWGMSMELKCKLIFFEKWESYTAEYMES